MQLGLPVMVQLALAFGLGGLFWPEKLLPVFEVLMFPWIASPRTIRFNSIMALSLSLMLFLVLLTEASGGPVSLPGLQ